MDWQTILTIASNVLAIFLVVGAVWFAAEKVWPWFEGRDCTERERRHELAKLTTTTAEAMALQLSVIAHHLENPLLVHLVDEDDSDLVQARLDADH